MHPNSPNSRNVLTDGSEVRLDCLSLEALFSAAEEGRLELFHRGQITPLGRMYFGDRCGKPVDQW
jgi:hypothetical protein